ncbi:MAG TPA: Rrf2 family transcriptional regulator [Bryobacteraceae bacterium]
MKLSAQEEYGVRCLIQVAGNGGPSGVTIPDISKAEGISAAHAAKLLRILRRSGFVKSVRGKVGGYSLSRPAHKIVLGDVLDALGGRLFETNFCKSHVGTGKICKHSTDCSLRTLWHTVQAAVDQVLERTTLQDLLRPESEMIRWVPTLSFAISNGVTSRVEG